VRTDSLALIGIGVPTELDQYRFAGIGLIHEIGPLPIRDYAEAASWLCSTAADREAEDESRDADSR